MLRSETAPAGKCSPRASHNHDRLDMYRRQVGDIAHRVEVGHGNGGEKVKCIM